MTHYQRGRSAEYRVIKRLEDVGYVCVRAAGSKGLFDVVAIGSKDIKLITVRYGGEPRLSPLEREALKMARRPSCTSIEYWQMTPRRPPIIEVI